jgi:hypothetical protein
VHTTIKGQIQQLDDRYDALCKLYYCLVFMTFFFFDFRFGLVLDHDLAQRSEFLENVIKEIQSFEEERIIAVKYSIQQLLVIKVFISIFRTILLLKRRIENFIWTKNTS